MLLRLVAFIVAPAAAAVMNMSSSVMDEVIGTTYLASADYSENFDSDGTFIYLSGTEGDIVKIDPSTGSYTVPITWMSHSITFTPTESQLTVTAVAKAITVVDNCTLLVGFNEGEPTNPAEQTGNPIGVEGGLATFDTCTNALLQYVDLTSFANGNITAITDAVVTSTGTYYASLFFMQKIISITGGVATEVLAGELEEKNCYPQGLAIVPSSGTMLISCFLFDTALTAPDSGLLRVDMGTMAVTAVMFDVNTPLQVDDIKFNPAGDTLYLSVGDLPGTPFANSVLSVTSTDDYVNVAAAMTYPSGCTPLSATTFVGDVLYGICNSNPVQTGIYKFWNAPPAAPPPPSPSMPPSTPPSAPSPSTPPSAPPGAPACMGSCQVYRNGADPRGTDYTYMCMKEEAEQIICTPLFGTGCDGGSTPCRQPGVSVLTPTSCRDDPGKWTSKKCPKKAAKGKCSSKRIARKCPLSCGTCS